MICFNVAACDIGRGTNPARHFRLKLALAEVHVSILQEQGRQSQAESGGNKSSANHPRNFGHPFAVDVNRNEKIRLEQHGSSHSKMHVLLHHLI